MTIFNLLIILYFLLFLGLAYFRFTWAIIFFLITLPAYLVRFNFGPFPSTVLELHFLAIFSVWLIKYSRFDKNIIKTVILGKKQLFIFIAVFFLASVVGIFRSDMVIASLGQWRAYFLEPLLFFIILIGRKNELPAKHIIYALILSALGVSLVAWAQKFTNTLFPPSLWDDVLNGRVVSFFTSPNSIGLFTVPVLFLTLFLPHHTKKKLAEKIILILILIFALLFSQSAGALLALAVALVFFVYFLNYKKTALVLVTGGLMLITFYTPLQQAVLFQDQSGQNRLTLWTHTYNYLTASPDNFILGTGIRQYFRKVEKPLYNPKELERLIYPHNILLNFWTEIGLLGLLGFVGIFINLLKISFNKYKNISRLEGLVFLTILIAWLTHGLVDVPYFKNDLSMIFWALAFLIINNNSANKNRNTI